MRGRGQSLTYQNRHLPRLAGSLKQASTGTFSGMRHKSRWAVLDPQAASLTIYSKPPPEDMERQVSGSSWGSWPSLGSWFSSGSDSSAKKTLKIHSLDRLTEVQYNPHFHNIFLRFGSDSHFVCLTAEQESDFNNWVGLLNRYLPQ